MSRCHNGLPSKTFNGVHFAGKVCSAISVSLFANTKAFFTEQHDTHQLLTPINGCKQLMKAETIITESKDLRIKTFNYGNRYYVKG